MRLPCRRPLRPDTAARRGAGLLALLAALSLAACQAPGASAPAQPAAPAPPAAPGSASAAAAPAATPAGSPAAPPAPQHVVLAIPAKSLAFLPYFVGVDQGLYEADGIQLEIQVMQSNLAVAAMTAGELAYTASTGSSIQAAVADQPFKVVLFMVKDMIFSVVGAPEITSLADLRGKTIAITNLTASDDYAWRAAVRAQGVSPDDVTAVTAQTTANSFAALTSGAVQAAVLSPPFDEQAERQGFRNLAWTADYLQRAQSGLVTTDKQLQERPADVRRMIRATLRSMQYTTAHEAESLALIERDFGIAPDLAEGTYQKVVRVLSRNGEVEPDVLRSEIEDNKVRLGVTTDVPLSRVMDYTLLREVQPELGLRS
ncbi:MAG TPA: ABC transporter substrate-binding protein [Chloroflexota bacterium]|nr:ABC transporter substrate-binding protein [Chloroflexota bacterium]